MEMLPRLVIRRLAPATIVKVPSCCASTGGRGNTQNVSRPGKNRKRGIKVADGDYVHPGYVLARQLHKFRWYPGAHVMVGKDMTLTAKASGTIRITDEIFVPDPSTELGEAVLDMPMGSLLYKPTISIIKEEEVGLFKLKERI